MSGSMNRDKSQRPSDEGASADLSSYDIIEHTDANQLREINQKLFSRLTDIRARNLELRKFEELSWEKDLEIVKLRSLENDLRKQLSSIRNDVDYTQQKREEHIQELTRLRLTIERHDHDLKTEKDEYNRKLARIADQSWEKDFEIKRLAEQSATLSSTLATLDEQRRERETQLAASQERIVKLARALAEANAEIERLEDRAELQSAQFADKFAEATGRREDEIARLHVFATELKATIVKLESERAQLQEDVKIQTRAAWELQARVDESHLAMADMQAAQVLEMKRVGEDYSLAIKKISDENAALFARAKEERAHEIAVLIQQHQNKIQQAQVESERKLSALSEKHDVETKTLRDVERDLSEQTVRLRIEVAGQVKQIETLNQSISDLRQALLAEKEQHRALKEELETRLSELHERENEIKELRNSETAVSTELAAEREKRRRGEGRNDEMHVRIVDLDRQVADLRDRLVVRQDAQRNAERTVEELQRRVDHFEAASDQWKTAEAKLQFELSQEKLKRQEDGLTFQRADHDAIQKISILESRMLSQKSEAEAVIAKQKADFDTAEEKSKIEIESIRERARVELENARERARMELEATRDKHEVKVKELSELAHDLGTQLHQQRENDAELFAEVGDCRYEIKKLKEEMPIREAAWVAEFSKIKSTTQAELADARATAQAELTRVKAEAAAELEQIKSEAKLAVERLVQENEAKLDASEMEKASLRRSLSTKNSNLDVESKEHETKARALAIREQQIVAREHQLRHYATAVTEQKAELIRQTKILAEEIQMAGKMHPLKDYLQLTEFELSKVDVQLRMTPTISMERPRLEACVKQMAEQRDFLRAVVEASTKRLEEQAANILALVKSPKLAATPPLPPRILVKDKEPALKIVPGMVAGAPSVASAAVTLVPTKPAQDLSSN